MWQWFFKIAAQNTQISKSKIFIHSLISSQLPCPNEWFQVKLFWKKYNKVAFLNLIISFGDSFLMLKSCWIHSNDNNFLSYCSPWWNELWRGTYKTVQNPELAICRCSARKVFLKNCKIHRNIPLRSLFYSKVASELWQNFTSSFSYRRVTDNCFWKWKTFFLSKFIIKVILIFNKLFFQT